MRAYTKDEIEKVRLRNPAWWEAECAPVGTCDPDAIRYIACLVMTKAAESLDDIRFAVDYGKAHDVDVKSIEKYLHDSRVIGRELSLGSYFGGASFYYYVPE